MIKKICRYLFLCSFAFVCLCSNVGFINKPTETMKKTTASAYNREQYISVSGKEEINANIDGSSKSYAYSKNNNGFIMIVISVNKSCVDDGPLTIKYRTENGTAVNAFKDYDSVNESYTFTSNSLLDETETNYYVTIPIKIYSYDISIGSGINGNNCNSYGKTFTFEIYEVDGVDLQGNIPDNLKQDCLIISDKFLLHQYNQTTKLYKLFAYYSSEALSHWHITEDKITLPGYETMNFSYENIQGTDIEPITMFADRWFTATYLIDEYVFDATNKYLDFRFYDEDYLDIYRAYYWNLYNEEIVIDVDHDGADAIVTKRGEYIDLTNTWGSTIPGRYFKFNGTRLSIYLDNFSPHNRYLGETDIYFRFYDTRDPYGANWYIDTDPVKKGEKVKLYIRMSEPVYVDANMSKPSIIMKETNGVQTVNFEYAYGSMTDTLVFEADPSTLGAVNLTSLSFYSIDNAKAIKDFGVNPTKDYNSFNSLNSKNNKNIACLIDTRTPQITNVKPTEISAGVKKEHLVTFEVNKILQGNAEVFVEWNKNSGRGDAEFSYSIPSTNFSFNETGNSASLSTSAVGLNGLYYLHIKAVNAYGNGVIQVYGPYKFDNESPVISNINVDISKVYEQRKAPTVLNITDSGEDGISSGIDKVYMVYTEEYRVYEGVSCVEQLVYDSVELSNVLKINGSNASINITTDMIGVDETTQFKQVFIGFYSIDKLGNQSEIVWSENSSYFDIRDLIQVEYLIENDNFIADDSVVIDIDKSGDSSKNKLICQLPDDDLSILFEVFSLINPHGIDVKSEFNIVYDSALKHIVIDFDLDDVGYYELILKATYEGEVEKYSLLYSFYLSDSFDNAVTDNYYSQSKGHVLRNKLYSLSSQSYYYKDSNGTVKVVNYNNSNLTQYFSSYEVAYSYVYFNELKDLYLFRINSASIADSLNISDGTYRKAEGEIMNAQVGQYWIRYKRSTWDNSKDDSGWVYYYYGTTQNILVENALSANLQRSLSAVSKTITDKGQYSYLTEYSGTVNGKPYLENEQIHFDSESITTTLSGSSFNTKITFIGDNSVYLGTVSVPNVAERVPYFTGFSFGQYTKLFYMKLDDYSDNPTFINNGFKQIYKDTDVDSIFTENGVYIIREIDENGVRDFYIYIDKIAPSINIVYSKKSGDAVYKIYDAGIHEKLYVYSFVLGNMINEIDELSYVTIKNTAGRLLKVYMMSDLNNEQVQLGNGKYIISVYDRTGNGYSFTVYVDSSELSVTVDKKDNYYIRVNSNREPSDIYSYEVWCNGILLSSSYSKQAIYENEGDYIIRIEDLYGERFETTISLVRVRPDVEWEYKKGDSFISYNSPESTIKIEKLTYAEHSYVLYSSDTIRFIYNKNEDYEFILTDATMVKTEISTGKAIVVITPTASVWSIEIFYKKFPNNKVFYKGIVDNDSPVIYPVYNGAFLNYYDLEEMKALIGTVPNGFEFNPQTIMFEKERDFTQSIANNETVYVSKIKLSIKDSLKVVSYKIFLNNKLLMMEENLNGTKTEFILTGVGDYVIEAYDIVGNYSKFTFKNEPQKQFSYSIDGKTLDYISDVFDYISINESTGKSEYTKIDYGSKSLSVKYSANTETTILITYNGQVYYIPLYIFEGEVIPVTYVNQDNVIKKVYGLSIFSIAEAKPDVEYRVYSYEDVGINVFIKYSGEDLFIDFVPKENDSNKCVIEVRTVYDELKSPFYLKSEIYGIEPKVQIDVNQESVEVSNEDVIYISQPFSFNLSYLESNNIYNVELYYSAIDSFDNLDNIYNPNEIYTNEGFWLVRATNIYGFVVEFKIIFSSTIGYSIESIYKDGTHVEYSSGYNKDIYSNNIISIMIYADRLKSYTIRKNGIIIDIEPITQNSKIKFELNDIGVYVIDIVDIYGNKINVNCEINYKTYQNIDNMFSGWNEKALMKDQGYTNQKLSILLDKINKYNFTGVEIIYKDVKTVLFDLNLENQLEMVEDDLINAIGNSGDGTYQVVFRDKFGNKLVSSIIYSETSTIKLSRTTRNLITTSYDINDVLVNGLWSNDTLLFDTISNRCLFTIDGVATDCPTVLKHKANKSYDIYYLDEFGFEFEFKAHLIRQDVEINLISTKEIVEINKMKTTKGNIQLIFDSNYKCSYVNSDLTETSYLSGSTIAKDGVYTFNVIDNAGNSQTIIIKRDTALKYSFISSVGKNVINGEIVNATKVNFRPDASDDVVIEKIFLDGIAQSDVGLTGFTKNGKWEIILTDGIGNRSYFSFYLITYETSTFDYKTPYNYIISEILYDDGSGVKVSYLDKVNVEEKHSVLTFTLQGTYSVVMKNMVSYDEIKFDVAIDNTPPEVSLVGCENNETTTENITLTGYETGDVINIYRDGKLVKTLEMTSASASPVINEKGQYRIEVTSKAGNVTVLEFTRQYTANKATSVLVIAVLVLLSIVLFIGIIYRRHSRVD